MNSFLVVGNFPRYLLVTAFAIFGSMQFAEAAQQEVRMNAARGEFEPGYLKIQPGDTVRFVPAGKSKTVGASSVLVPDGAYQWEGVPGRSFSVKLSREGIYIYQSAKHLSKGMVGAIQAGRALNEEQAKRFKLPQAAARAKLESLLAQVEASVTALIASAPAQRKAAPPASPKLAPQPVAPNSASSATSAPKSAIKQPLGSAEAEAMQSIESGEKQQAAQVAAANQEVNLPEVRVSGAAERGYRATAASAGVLGDRGLLETPFSVNVITRELIEEQQGAFLGDYLKNDPSAVVSNVPVGFLTLRGFPVGTDGFLYDGMVGNVGLSDGRGQLESFERIEVLKGASAFLNGLGGASSLGGTLNYIPKTPETPLRSVALNYTSKSLFGLHTDLGDRFGANRQFGYRVNLAYKDGEQATDGYDWTHKVAAIALDWRAAPSLVFSTTFEAADNNLPRLQPFFALSPGISVPKAPDANRNIALSWDNFETRARNAQIRADWAFAQQWSLTAQALHSSDKRPAVKNARFGVIQNADGDAILFGDQGPFDTIDSSAQVRVNGKAVTGSIEHDIAAGVNAFREKQRGSTSSESLGVFPTNIFDPVDFPEPASIALTTGIAQRSKGYSVFLSDIVSFNERWSVLLGARRAKLDVDSFDVTSSARTGSNTISKTTPTVALMFKPARNSLLYANYAEGLEQGGTAPVGSVNADQRLGPIVTKQYELGGKLDLPNLGLTAALFDMRRPLEITDPSSNLFVQDGEQRHRGIEFTATGSLSRNLTVIAGAMLLDPKAEDTGDPATEGRTPIGVAKVTANLWGSYRISAVPGLSLNGGVFYSGAQYADGANAQRVPSWTRLDVGLRYDHRLSTSKVSYLLGVENLADRDYWTGAQQGLLVLSNPRTFKASAKVDF
jgi:iron complex outermembrane recepter protein